MSSDTLNRDIEFDNAISANPSHPQSGKWRCEGWILSVPGTQSLAASIDAASSQEALSKYILDSIQQTISASGALLPRTEREFPLLFTIQPLDKSLRKLEMKIIAVFESDPLEDGYFHPAENLLREMILEFGDRAFLFIQRMIMDKAQPALGASVLRCLGRITTARSEQWRATLIDDALKNENIEVRDAAIQAAELWSGNLMATILERHNEPVDWLHDYMNQVIRDIKSE